MFLNQTISRSGNNGQLTYYEILPYVYYSSLFRIICILLISRFENNYTENDVKTKVVFTKTRVNQRIFGDKTSHKKSSLSHLDRYLMYSRSMLSPGLSGNATVSNDSRLNISFPFFRNKVWTVPLEISFLSHKKPVRPHKKCVHSHKK